MAEPGDYWLLFTPRSGPRSGKTRLFESPVRSDVYGQLALWQESEGGEGMVLRLKSAKADLRGRLTAALASLKELGVETKGNNLIGGSPERR